MKKNKEKTFKCTKTLVVDFEPGKGGHVTLWHPVNGVETLFYQKFDGDGIPIEHRTGDVEVSLDKTTEQKTKRKFGKKKPKEDKVREGPVFGE